LKHLTAILAFSVCALLTSCMSQETATKQPGDEFTRTLPHYTKAALYDKVAAWMSNNAIMSRQQSGAVDDVSASIISHGDTEIAPDGSLAALRVGFTMSVYVKDEAMKIKFTNLRRLYGSQAYDVPINDRFFRSSTGMPYHRAARVRFSSYVQSLSDYIKQ